MSAAQLQPMVFEQWLMSDLKELEAACLPADLPLQLSTQINGPFALQVNFCCFSLLVGDVMTCLEGEH